MRPCNPVDTVRLAGYRCTFCGALDGLAVAEGAEAPTERPCPCGMRQRRLHEPRSQRHTQPGEV